MATTILEEIAERLRREQAGGAPAAMQAGNVWAPQASAPGMTRTGGNADAFSAIAPNLFGGGRMVDAPDGGPDNPIRIEAPGAGENGGGFFGALKRGLANIDAITWMEIAAALDTGNVAGIASAFTNQRDRRNEDKIRAQTADTVERMIESGSTGEDPFDPAIIEAAKRMPADQALEILTRSANERQQARQRRADRDYVSPYQRERDRVEDEREERRLGQADRRERRISSGGGRRGAASSGEVPSGFRVIR